MRLLTVSLCLLLGTAHAASFKFNQDDGDITFEIIKFKIGSKVAGSFKQFSGTAEIDEAKGELVKTSVTVQTASVDTAEAKRDDHLKSPDFFDVAKYPTITFVSTGKPVKIGPDFKLPGKLTIKGVTKDVVFNMKRPPAKVMGWMFEGSAKINRLDYGVTWNKSMEQGDWKTVLGKLGKAVLDDEVDVKISILLPSGK